MRIGIPKEVYPGERRVASTPDIVKQLIKLGFEIFVEKEAGVAANFSDKSFEEAGAKILEKNNLFSDVDILLKIRAPFKSHDLDELSLMRSGQVLISFIWPAQNQKLLDSLSNIGVTALAMDSVPRISRAQKFDALSSMANIAGYRAVVEAAQHFGRFFTGQITAAGKIPPAKVLVIGAGVAGLSAIGAARSMGAIVRAFDTRLEVKEQVQSMDGEFLELDFKEDGSGAGGYAKTMSEEFIKAEMELFADQSKDVDIIITTALIPGKPAPKLITTDMVKTMKPGSVIVDLAAEQGGNCELTIPGEVSEKHEVTLIGYTDLPSRLATQSSQLYANNIKHLLTDMCPNNDGVLIVDLEDEVIRGSTVTHKSKILWPPPEVKLSSINETKKQTEEVKPKLVEKKSNPILSFMPFIIVGLGLFFLGRVAPPSFMEHLTVFVLSCFIGYMVVWNVTPALHTPLMSVTNAISSIIIIGALLQISSSGLIGLVAAITILLTSINITGGFAVTRRMLQMFQK